MLSQRTLKMVNMVKLIPDSNSSYTEDDCCYNETGEVMVHNGTPLTPVTPITEEVNDVIIDLPFEETEERTFLDLTPTCSNIIVLEQSNEIPGACGLQSEKNMQLHSHCDSGNSDIIVLEQNIEIPETSGLEISKHVTGSTTSIQPDDSESDYQPEDENLSEDAEERLEVINSVVSTNSQTHKRLGGGRKKNEEEKSTRKRLRNLNNWAQNVRKSKKEKGEEYVTRKGIIKNAKKLKLPCNCKSKCYEKLNEGDRKQLFKKFYELSRDGQDQYIAESVTEHLKSRERISQQATLSRRKFSRKYYLNTSMKSDRLEVCQQMYLNTFDLTLKKVRVIVERKRKAGGIVCPPDKRGKHGNQPKIPEKNKDIIRKHIESIPAYTSHYSRERTSKKYLSPDLSISLLYRLYCEHCTGSNIKPETEFQYRQIFNEEYNLSFHPPANDTCSKCDRINLALKSLNAKQDLSEEDIRTKLKLETERKNHMDLASSAYNNKSDDKNRSKVDPTFITASFDLEKCLPTPYLRNNVSFYKRQLWVFNLTVFHTSTTKNTGTCFIWDETTAGRGGQEIASCIRKFVKSLPETVKEIHFYSDSCSGQNRNIFMSTMFCILMKELQMQGSSLKEIHHKFMEPGHSHMEADTIHAAIEKAKKKTTVDIEVPHDWVNFIKMINRNPPLEVIDMKQVDFVNFNSLLRQQLVYRKKNEDGEVMPWLKVKWMKYTQDDEFQFFYKLSLGDDEFRKMDLRRGMIRRRSSNFRPELLQPLHSEPLPLPDLKKKNLMELLDYVNEHNKAFYESIRTASELPHDELPYGTEAELGSE